MKRLAALLCALCLFVPMTANAAYTQNDIYTAVNRACNWMEANASPLNKPNSSSADYYIMALSKLGKSYDYVSYVSITESRNPSTKQDGQRLVMSNTACGEKLSDSFVGIYTYNADFESAADIAGAIITLKSCGYEIKKKDYNFNHMIVELLQKQQSNGSFNNDVLSTAKSLLALSYFPGLNYSITVDDDNNAYNYSTDDAILNAITYIESGLNSDGGYPTVATSAYVIMALDSIGIDADNDTAFLKSGKSLLNNLLSAQADDGSFNKSADDTSIALCALTSHILSMQGKTTFFNFTDNITANTPLDDENFSGTGVVTNMNSPQSTASTDGASEKILITPPTHTPEHSSFDAEEYGPYPFVGPIKQDFTEKQTPKKSVEQTNNTLIKVIAIISVMIICILGIVLIYLNKRFPEKLNKIVSAIRKVSSDD